ncbi:ROK family transcriptional regulator [Leifsonia sp. F6_8S_P_1B]|uniref:ROK family transcriptional regulator n=1 Tax=Leifsonia williamsii TaxID=3035919 RepID=A0ABT8KAP6_9MICO|nr:ROK family transcriptional regulator [Leifsonia williamsii]MDN4614083.1 ROK family transcriptional regulator [Leifsonia williamsii]
MSTSGSPSVLRVLNDRAALEVLVREETVSRSQLENLVGLSKPATSQLLARLEHAGLVAKAGHRQDGPGPRAQLWSLKADAGFAAGVDVSAAGIDVAIADLRGTVVAEEFTPADRLGPRDALLVALTAASVKAGIAPETLTHISIGIPGAVDQQTGYLRYASELPGWKQVDLLHLLDDALPVPVTIENDVNLVALNEMAHGTAQGRSDFFLLWIAERGVGSSVVVGGELIRGATLGAGEIGFTPVPDLATATTPFIGHRFGDLITNAALLDLAAAHGIRATGAIDALEQGLATDPDGFPRDFARRISAGLAAVVSILDPELIILDGDICVAGGDRLAALVAESLAGLVEPRVPIVSGRDDASSVRAGAVQAALVPAREAHFAAGSTIDVP